MNERKRFIEQRNIKERRSRERARRTLSGTLTLWCRDARQKQHTTALFIEDVSYVSLFPQAYSGVRT